MSPSMDVGKESALIEGYAHLNPEEKIRHKPESLLVWDKGYSSLNTANLTSPSDEIRSLPFYLFSDSRGTKWPSGQVGSVPFGITPDTGYELRNASIRRSRRSVQSVQLIHHRCGKHEVYVPQRKPCPPTCDDQFSDKPPRCINVPPGPGCECAPGYVLDGILCVPPSQCGCLNAVCIDRVPSERCIEWRAQGRCATDRVAMAKVCRATCNYCKQMCENQIANSVCQKIKTQGRCRDDLYQALCRLTCAPQFCSCPPCRTVRGPCDPHLRNREIRRICYRLRRDGKCVPLINTKFKPCGACKSLRLYRKVCENGNRIIHKFATRTQISCEKCVLKEFAYAGRPLVCNADRVKRDCPPAKRSAPFCDKVRDQLGVHVTVYQAKTTKCIEQTTVSWLPRKPCPPRDLISQTGNPDEGKFSCDLNTCQRTWHNKVWQWEGCECRSTDLALPAGKCCCPKEQVSLSPCINGVQDKKTVFYELVDGNCVEHVRQRRIHCACPPKRVFQKCDPITNQKHIKSIIYTLMQDGSCKKEQRVEVHPTHCPGGEIKRITPCNIRRPGSNRMYRQILVSKPQIVQCTCREPRLTVVLEACACPEANLPPVRQIQQCPRLCFGLTDERCDSRCQNVYVSQRLVYASVETGRCVPEVIRKTIKYCCCQRNLKISRHCALDGEHELIRIQETILQEDRCIQVFRQIRQKIHCRTGFIGRSWDQQAGGGGKLMRLVYGYREKCGCKTRTVVEACNQVCPKPTTTVICDPGSREFVHTLVNYVPVGCKCEKLVYKRRSSVLCPEFTRLLSAHCSLVTNLETRRFLRAFQDKCECKQEEFTKTKPCGCPKSVVSPSRCDPRTNRIQFIRTAFELRDGNCIPRKDLREKLVNCEEERLREPRQNDGRYVTYLSCDPNTGLGRLWRYTWEPRECKCVRTPQIIREGICKCPAPKTVMYCDGRTNMWIRTTNAFVLDRKALQCRQVVHQQAEPTCKSGPSSLAHVLSHIT
ncbi:unnamed protein product [Calicophoron daubneyi]|uniref:ShKT domain-containing protein n=1 Tax=Calicophoron daubneyi TaxID=300641 RepID=A0AAV2TJ67_CALDB